MILAKVDEIRVCDDVSCVSFSADNSLVFTMLSLENLNLKVGDKVALDFKSSDVVIATTRILNCSLKNEIPCEILDIKFGEILVCIKLKYQSFEFESIITALSAKTLNLKVGMSIFAYVKSTSVFISEVL